MRLGEGRFNRPHILPSLSKREVRMGLEAFTSALFCIFIEIQSLLGWNRLGLLMQHIDLLAIKG